MKRREILFGAFYGECVNVTWSVARLCLEPFSVNVLMWHEAVQIVFGDVSECAAEKKSLFWLNYHFQKKYDDLQSTLNNKTPPFKFLQRASIWTETIWSERFWFRYILNKSVCFNISFSLKILLDCNNDFF